jgi:hypothetical protein
MIKFSLIHSSYQKDECYELLTRLIEVKIDFLTKKIASNNERGLDTVHYEVRQSFLLEQRDQLYAMIFETKDGMVKVTSELEVENVEL